MEMRAPTISEIKEATLEKSPYYFSRDTMKHFGQTMRDFKVRVSPQGNIYIYAPVRERRPYQSDYNSVKFYSLWLFYGEDLHNINSEDVDRNSLASIEAYIKAH